MSMPPPPDQLIALPSTHFTTHASSPVLPSLRIYIRPYLMIPTPLMSPLVLGRKVEECVHVIVPVGGRVELSIKVESEGLEGTVEIEEDADQMMNAAILALSPLAPIHAPYSAGISTIHLNPLTASPANTYINTPFIPTGHITAHLAKIALQCSWLTRPVPRRRAGIDEEPPGFQKEEADPSVFEADEEILPFDVDDDGERKPLDCGDDGENGDDDLLFEDLDDAVDVLSLCAVIQPHERQALNAQVKQAIGRLIREQMIRRFPLIFDGALLKYSHAIRLPPALPVALTRFFSLSMTHRRLFTEDARPILKSIKTTQETLLANKIEQAVHLPTRKTKKRKLTASIVNTEQQDQEDNNEPCQGSSKRSRSTSSRFKSNRAQCVTSKLEDEPGSDERAATYIAQCKLKLMDQAQGAHGEEEKMKRVLGDAVTRIARAAFDRKRKRGALRYNAIALVFEDEEAAVPTPSLPRLVNTTVTTAPFETSNPDDEILLDDFEDEQIEHNEDDEMLLNDDDLSLEEPELELEDCDALILDENEDDIFGDELYAPLKASDAPSVLEIPPSTYEASSVRSDLKARRPSTDYQPPDLALGKIPEACAYAGEDDPDSQMLLFDEEDG